MLTAHAASLAVPHRCVTTVHACHPELAKGVSEGGVEGRTMCSRKVEFQSNSRSYETGELLGKYTRGSAAMMSVPNLITGLLVSTIRETGKETVSLID